MSISFSIKRDTYHGQKHSLPPIRLDSLPCYWLVAELRGLSIYMTFSSSTFHTVILVQVKHSKVMSCNPEGTSKKSAKS